jgi:hypothetical protein
MPGKLLVALPAAPSAAGPGHRVPFTSGYQAPIMHIMLSSDYLTPSRVPGPCGFQCPWLLLL